MKHTLLFFAFAFALFSCVNTTPQQESNPEQYLQHVDAKQQTRTVPDSEFCKTISIPEKTSRAVGVRGKFWTVGQTLKIGFIGGTAAQRKYATDGWTEWAKYVNLKFTYPAKGPYDIRIAFNSGDGAWSYIGLDCKTVSASQPTMNIGWSGLDVCLHEEGHALGMAHEQASPKSAICWNKPAVYAALGGPPNYWNKPTVDFNVFQTLTDAEAQATAWDANSIMQYSIPASWLCAPSTGIPGGKVLSDLDKSFMTTIYPGLAPPPVAGLVSLPGWQRDSLVRWLSAAK
jgi:hypothetical protein